ncbi:acyltransferase family protein [Scandinavium lactucae]|uniref:Acyltransferase family protein n=1 Tax=Scandinavium lactucae TaxID=3095028 RepID=A0ABU4QTQ2_9ENTR|nr:MULTISPECIES: acyltransferase family protein [unclassified Scandinavium]MDX6042663.1 acyltransferase family protein [Scandinavium sp. V105_6]MDX6052664.1 acyltransferase family protein [Scandinavium sp. V105_1]
MKEKALWINQIKGLCICLVVFYHSVITFYPHLSTFQHPWSPTLAKCWVYFNLYLAPFRMPVFFFISGFLIQRYINGVSWRDSLGKRVGTILWVLALWGVLQWQALSHITHWLAPDRDVSTSANAAYADSLGEFVQAMLTASTSLWYLYALIVYFVLCKLTSRGKTVMIAALALLSIAINFLPTPWWGMNSVLRNVIYYALGAWFGTPLMAWMKTFDIRRHWLMLGVVAFFAVGLWFVRTPLLLSLLSIFIIMKVFYAVGRRYPPSERSLLNVVGSNTIAIYTTHRILVEIFSLVLIGWFSAQARSPSVELAILLCYPFFSLLLCVATGMLARSLSQRLAGDILFSPPAVALNRQ